MASKHVLFFSPRRAYPRRLANQVFPVPGGPCSTRFCLSLNNSNVSSISGLGRKQPSSIMLSMLYDGEPSADV
jgi:hypothetical protein